MSAKRLAVFFAGVVICAVSCTNSAKERLPFKGRNVVVIVLDTTRFDHMGFNGYGRNTTPFLDSLAKQAVVFERAYSASSWTAPATASIFTSLYPDQHGVTSGYFFYKRMAKGDTSLLLNQIPSSAETLPEMMQRAGYQTFGAADNMNVCERMGFTRGFDHFGVWPYAGGDLLNAYMSKWKLAMEESDKPFFIYAQYMDPHKPYHKREGYYKNVMNPGKAHRGAIARYNSELRYTDELLRQLFTEFDLDSNTLVIITADHGEEFGEHGHAGHGSGLYEELVHVPLMILGRDGDGDLDFEPGRSARTVSTVDLLPTLRELLDQPAAEIADGQSLAGSLGDAGLRASHQNVADERFVFSHRSAEGIEHVPEFYSVTSGPWQLILQVEADLPELYNVGANPKTRRNQVLSEPEVFARLIEPLRAFIARERQFEPQFADELILDKAAQDKLGRLGYAE